MPDNFKLSATNSYRDEILKLADAFPMPIFDGKDSRTYFIALGKYELIQTLIARVK